MKPAKELRVGLYCDREDWILGTIARQIKAVHEGSGQFRFNISSWPRFLESPFSQIRIFKGCDIIHWLSPQGYGDLGALFPGAKQICTIHHCLPNDNNYPQKYCGSRVLTISKQTLNELKRRGFRDTVIVNDGVDEKIFQPLDKTHCRQLLNISGKRPLIGFFGKETSNPQDRKGTQMLLETLRLVNETLPVALLISGEGWGSLVERVESLGVEVFRRRAATLDKMPVFYGALDLFLCTARIEGGPVTVLEAMACERPVVSTPVGHVPDLIRNGENGFVVSIDDAPAAANILDLLMDNKANNARLGHAARETILENWTWDKVLQPLGRIYLEVANGDALNQASHFEAVQAYMMLFIKSLRQRFIRNFK